MGRGDVWDGDAGTSNIGTQEVKSEVNLFLRENVLFMVNIRFHRPEPHQTPYDVYTKYFFIVVKRTDRTDYLD